jgi:hypothetical protein
VVLIAASKEVTSAHKEDSGLRLISDTPRSPFTQEQNRNISRSNPRHVDSRRGLGIFLFTTASGTPLGPTQPPTQWVLKAVSLGIKRPAREVDHLPPSSAEVTNAWNYTSTPQYAFMAWCFLKQRDNFTLSIPFNPRRDGHTEEFCVFNFLCCSLLCISVGLFIVVAFDFGAPSYWDGRIQQTDPTISYQLID